MTDLHPLSLTILPDKVMIQTSEGEQTFDLDRNGLEITFHSDHSICEIRTDLVDFPDNED